jgi:hypothetical protein
MYSNSFNSFEYILGLTITVLVKHSSQNSVGVDTSKGKNPRKRASYSPESIHYLAGDKDKLKRRDEFY